MARNIKVKVAKTKHGTKVQSPMIVHESSIFSFKTVFLMMILLGLIVLTHLELKEQFVLNNIIEPLLSGKKSVPEEEKRDFSSTSVTFHDRLQNAMDAVEKVSLMDPPTQIFKPVITPTPNPTVTTQTDVVKPIVTASVSNVVTKYHAVVSGDILYNIAQKYGVNYKDLADWNNIDNPADLKLGQKLLLSEPAKPTVVAVNNKGLEQPAYHVVKSGDFLAKIAKQYNVNYMNLARWNNIAAPYALKLEQKLLVSEPPKTKKPEPVPVIDKHHIVKSGDFLAKIAKQYNVNYMNLARWNNIAAPYALKLGQKLLVSEPPKPTVVAVIDHDKDGVPDDKDFCQNTTTEEISKGIDNMGCVIKTQEKPKQSEQPAYHVVKSGDFLAKIAKQYNVNYMDLARWNNIAAPYALKLGQKLLVSEPPKPTVVAVIDHDKDGVPDDKDFCQNTTTEEISKGIDNMGCVIKTQEKPKQSEQPAYHVVKSGDFLAKIAKQYNVNYMDLARWNNIAAPYALKLGQKLLVSEPEAPEAPEAPEETIIAVPDNDKDGVNDDKDSCPNTTTDEIIKGVDDFGCVIKTAEKPAYHIVKSGDFLAKISKRYRISYKDLARWNNLPRPYNLKLGQKLVLSAPLDQDHDDVPDDKDHCLNTTIEEIGKGVDAMGCVINTPEISKNEPVYHIVKRGESLFKISRLYKVSYTDLARWNNISISSSLNLGQKLLVSKPIESFLSVDTDEDGIDDDKDRCPNNTEDEVINGVDENGCAIKIEDYFDFPKKKVSKPVLRTTKKKLLFHDRLRNGNLGPQMVWIPAGSFKMGDLQGGGEKDEQPIHKVDIKRFASSRYEITFSDYDKFATATRRKKPHDEGWGRGIRPVINVNWEDARAYCTWLSRETGHHYRLPTEAEWEYAARAGSKTKYWWGNRIGTNNATCNKCNSKWGWDAQNMTAPVGSFKANPFGLYDTVGNVYEWTCSAYGVELKANKKELVKYNGKEQTCVNRKTKNKFRVIRGGHWLSDPEDNRAAHRFESWLGYRVNFIGFRVVRE
ncbi:LysM peptidoglycan-binding domain-containing protein [Candidatus Marithrix sp. Canyon 246]|uniref:LysM peptidoglycan-binding domain-containing protein n=1 Tax=Candidatus Marithrix sp. Canyon 246 TaxID=1827136 RepID=UPI000849FF3B|nr:LysM peptidoglycan-binding domain-containing protein [Candidatus Marithrix sp. Canyon 246]